MPHRRKPLGKSFSARQKKISWLFWVCTATGRGPALPRTPARARKTAAEALAGVDLGRVPLKQIVALAVRKNHEAERVRREDLRRKARTSPDTPFIVPHFTVPLVSATYFRFMLAGVPFDSYHLGLVCRGCSAACAGGVWGRGLRKLSTRKRIAVFSKSVLLLS